MLDKQNKELSQLSYYKSVISISGNKKKNGKEVGREKEINVKRKKGERRKREWERRKRESEREGREGKEIGREYKGGESRRGRGS